MLPSLFLGPLLIKHPTGITRMLSNMTSGKMPQIPKVSMGLVNIDDVLDAYLKVLEPGMSEETNGKRYILS